MVSQIQKFIFDTTFDLLIAKIYENKYSVVAGHEKLVNLLIFGTFSKIIIITPWYDIHMYLHFDIFKEPWQHVADRLKRSKQKYLLQVC